MNVKFIKNAGIVLLMITLASCSDTDEETVTEVEMKPDSTALAGSENKTRLFDGETFAGWHGFNKTGAIKNWVIEDSALVCLGAEKNVTGGDIVTQLEYENFDLSWQWKVTNGGSSGVMYHVVESPKHKAPYETGPKYQLIDDIGYPEKLEDWQKSGADYAMYVPASGTKALPVGKWNSSRIVFNKGQVEQWLNGKKAVAFEAWSAEWKMKKSKSKWKDYPDYGNARKGHIALQGHGNKVYFKNILITELPAFK